LYKLFCCCAYCQRIDRAGKMSNSIENTHPQVCRGCALVSRQRS
jgi:hypothetical protein